MASPGSSLGGTRISGVAAWLNLDELPSEPDNIRNEPTRSDFLTLFDARMLIRNYIDGRCSTDLLVEIAASNTIVRETLLMLRGLQAVSALNLLQKVCRRHDNQTHKLTQSINQWLDESGPEYKLKRYAIHLLVKLSASSGELPSSLFVREVDIGAVRDPTCTGGFADIYRGTYLGITVAIKRLRISESQKAELYPVCSPGLCFGLQSPNRIRNFAGRRSSGDSCTTLTSFPFLELTQKPFEVPTTFA
jgi:hypothetical protein